VTDITDLQGVLEQGLVHETSSTVTISNLGRLAGGASKETWRLDLHVADGPWQGEHRLVLLRQMGGKIYASGLDIAGEYGVIVAAHAAGVPVPRPFWLLPDVLGRPAALLLRLPGESIGRRIVRAPELEEARAELPRQMGGALAAIHRIDPDASGLRGVLPEPPAGVTPIRAEIDQLEANLDQIGEPHPAIELALRWLRRHEPPPPEWLVTLHGDYRIGNMLVTPAGLSGIIDWEFAHLGDPAEDLAWGLIREWRFGVDELRFGGVGEPEAFFAGYEQAGGLPVDTERVRYWEVLHNIRWAVGTLNQARRHLSGEERNLEFASLGRRCAEMELEALMLIRAE
jgi:aminoglycoside phosphotransferase (APT) family kinase protein